jgi:opine dehydrogenase
VTEDVPYGLVPTASLGAMTGQTARLHQAGVEIFSAMYGVDFNRENTLIPALDLDRISLAELKSLAKHGFSVESA